MNLNVIWCEWSDYHNLCNVDDITVNQYCLYTKGFSMDTIYEPNPCYLWSMNTKAGYMLLLRSSWDMGIIRTNGL